MILVTYKCTCMPKEVTVEVPSRPDGADLMVWMGVVQATLGMDHQARSPNCRVTTMEYAKIPIDEEADGIGMQRKVQ